MGPLTTKIAKALAHAWNPARNLKSLGTVRSPRFASLDGIRAIAYLWVLSIHVYIAYGYVGSFGKARRGFWQDPHFSLARNAQQGVDLFFMLSGFLMALLLRKEAKRDGIRWRRFLIRRWMRIFPAYAFALVAWVIFLYSAESLDMCRGSVCRTAVRKCERYWWTNLLFINNFFPSSQACLGLSWTVAVEFQMYLLTPPLIVLHATRPKFAMSLLGVLSLASVVATFVILAAMDWTCHAVNNQAYDILYKPTVFRWAPYCIGIALALLMDGRGELEDPPARDHKEEEEEMGEKKDDDVAPLVDPPAEISKNSKGRDIFILVLKYLAICILVWWGAWVDKWWWKDLHHIGDRFLCVTRRPAVALGAAILVRECICGRQRPIAWILGSLPLRVIGGLSYSAYLTQYIATSVFASSAHAGGWLFTTTPGFLLGFTFTAVVNLCIALIIFLALEKPVMNLR